MSLLPTCCGSTQPASDPTANVSVPPALAGPAPPEPELFPPLDEQALSASTAAVTRAAGAVHRVAPVSGYGFTESFLLLEKHHAHAAAYAADHEWCRPRPGQLGSVGFRRIQAARDADGGVTVPWRPADPDAAPHSPQSAAA
ncbi:hypothetical protein GCM10017557_04600 [Streptomyces aurantiacus]|uniref:Uncharacterized protein n=1 Tax=Streptomyces aurantiacus TaxID=47760 RepID=A0A7G1NT16_9ACTN|nr:hypothetical protein GCM10017557_04600 [Streptomyces aurantiacus]